MKKERTWVRHLTKDEFFYVVEDNYDEHIEVAIPFYRQMHEEVSRLALAGKKIPERILDLGSGTGKTSYCLLDAIPSCTIRAVDLFDEMHEHARVRLARFGNRVEFVTGDFMEVDLGTRVDLCISSLAIHHQRPEGKKALFSRIHKALSPDGAFVMIDWTKFISPALNHVAQEVAEHHAYESVAKKSVAREWCDHWRVKNIPDSTDDLCAWLREVGFVSAECVLRYYGMSLLFASKTNLQRTGDS